MSRDLSLLHPKLRAILPRIAEAAAAQGLPVLWTDGMRTKAEQDALYAKGRTAPGSIVTNVKYPNSMHNWGVAVDFCRNVRGREYDDSDNFFFRVAQIAKAYGLEWGGDWTTFVDKPHLQLAGYSMDGSTAFLRKMYKTLDAFFATWPKEEQASSPTVAGFYDVPANAWYAEALEWAVKAGIISGFEDSSFRPDQYLTRAQIVSVLYRYDAWRKGQK